MPLVQSTQRITIFFSYATTSPLDQQLFQGLTKQLSMLRREHLIDRWYDSAIEAGNEIAQTIQGYLHAADIIVLLLSAAFLASDRCYDLEMQLALERGKAGAQVIPVLLSPSEWETLPLQDYELLPASGKAVSQARNREAALLEVARGIRRVVEKLAGRTTSLLAHLTSTGTPLFDLPYRQNDFFTDRETILAQISAYFGSPQSTQTRILALNGLGGIGKTQVAQTYTQLSARKYRQILWLDASSCETLSHEIGQLAPKLAIPDKERRDEEHLFAALKRWLQFQTSWLLILDHIDDPNLLSLFIPPQSQGHVLLTMRTQPPGEIASVVPVRQMENDASVSFLLRRAKILSLEAPLDQVAPDIRQAAENLVQLMDGFPLALDQAGRYIEETNCGLPRYLELFHNERRNLLAKRGRAVPAQSHQESAAITLALTIEQVRQRNAINLPLLHLLAFLHPEAIPYTLLEDGAREAPEALRSLLAHPLALYEALADLRSYALIQTMADATTFCIHRLVQATLIDDLPKKEQRQWASLAVRMIKRVFPEADFTQWATCQRYLQQAQHCATLIATFKLTMKDAAILLRRLGSYCQQQAHLLEAHNYLTQALKLHEQRTWRDEEERAHLLNALGTLFYQQALYAEAEQSYLRALALREQLFGREHLQTAESLHNLALLSGRLGHYRQAEQYYQRTLEIEEHIPGADQLESAKTLNNLGLLAYEQGDYEQAKNFYLRALTIYRSSPDQPPALIHTLDGLGTLASDAEDLQQALTYYQDELTLCQQIYGEEHLETAHSLNKLADIYETMEREQEARELYQRALSIGEKILGPDHPDVALFLNNLAFLVEKQGEYQQAERLYLRALALYERAFGAEHHHVADILNNLAELARSTQDESRAETLHRRALAIRTQTLGSTHPDTAQSMSNLADILAMRGMDQEAEDLFQRALAIRLQTFGPAHASTERTREKYASFLERLGRSTEAIKLRQGSSEDVKE